MFAENVCIRLQICTIFCVNIKANEDASLREKHIIACVWDFDKTLIPGYMQTPVLRNTESTRNYSGKR